MRPELNLTTDEKIKIIEWKHSLPQNQRKFIHTFIESGELTDDGYKLYNYVINTNDDFSLLVSENVQLC
jgi:uncharacterized protein YydD (DUF2326 family)